MSASLGLHLLQRALVGGREAPLSPVGGDTSPSTLVGPEGDCPRDLTSPEVCAVQLANTPQRDTIYTVKMGDGGLPREFKPFFQTEENKSYSWKTKV